MQKVVLKPGDVIPDKAVFDSVNVTGESELLGIVVYVPEPIVNSERDEEQHDRD